MNDVTIKFDLADWLLVLGIVSIVGGVGWVSRPAGFVVAGGFCLFFVWALSKKKDAAPKKARRL